MAAVAPLLYFGADSEGTCRLCVIRELVVLESSQVTLSKTFLQRIIAFCQQAKSPEACIVDHRGMKGRRAKGENPSEHLVIVSRGGGVLIRASLVLPARIDNWYVHPFSAGGVIILSD